MVRHGNIIKNEEGFSLIEIIVSIFILSIIVTSVSVALIYSTKASGDNEIKMHALNIANKTVEDIRAMEFSDIETKFRTDDGSYIYGDPAGEILQEKIVNHNGLDYQVNVNINWEEQAEWDLAGNAEWDYKSVSVSVTPLGYSTFNELKQTIETYVTRDFSQPALTGSNIRIRCIRGWKLAGEDTKVVQGMNALLESGPSAIRFVNTSSRGVASFIGLTPGNYRVKLNLDSQGYMVHPNSTNILNLSLTDLQTESIEVEIEKPCELSFALRDLSGNPITPERLSSTINGEICLGRAYPYNSTVGFTFLAGNIDGNGRLDRKFGNLWPVGDGYSGVYQLQDISLGNYQYIGAYVNSLGIEKPWDGKFDNPGTEKEIFLYFVVAPVTPVGFLTDWVEDTNIRTGSFNAVDEDGDPIEAGILASSNLEETLVLSNNKEADFNGLKIFIENTGVFFDPGLQVKRNANLRLHGKEIIFRGKVVLERGQGINPSGRIYLATTWEDGLQASDIYGSIIDDEKADINTVYGKLYLTEDLYLGNGVIVDQGGYYFPDGTMLPDESNKLIPFTKENYVD